MLELPFPDKGDIKPSHLSCQTIKTVLAAGKRLASQYNNGLSPTMATQLIKPTHYHVLLYY